MTVAQKPGRTAAFEKATVHLRKLASHLQRLTISRDSPRPRFGTVATSTGTATRLKWCISLVSPFFLRESPRSWCEAPISPGIWLSFASNFFLSFRMCWSSFHGLMETWMRKSFISCSNKQKLWDMEVGQNQSACLWNSENTCFSNGGLKDSSVFHGLSFVYQQFACPKTCICLGRRSPKVDSLSFGNLSLMNNCVSACRVRIYRRISWRCIAKFDDMQPRPCKRSQKRRHQAQKQQTLEKMIRAQVSWTHHFSATKILLSKETKRGHLNLQKRHNLLLSH